MDRSLHVAMATPDACVVEHGRCIWATCGLGADESESLRRHALSRPGMEADLCRRLGDAAIVRIDLSRGDAPVLAAWKGISAGYDLFYRIAADGTVTVSDHFRNILSTVPVADRVTDHQVLCDHFLFRTIPGNNTLSRSVKRLNRGESVHIDLGTGESRRDRFDRVDVHPERHSMNVYLDRLDHALDSVLEAYRSQPDVASLFSGGVDSTLMQSYLGTGIPAVRYELPWYAEGFETNYADRAAEMLHIQVAGQTVDLDHCLDLLESAIDEAALPPPHLQLTLYQPLFSLNPRRFLFGEQADALFGIELRRARLASPFASAAGRALLTAAGALPSSRRQRIRQIREAARRLAHPPRALEGYGAQFGIYTHRPLLEAVFGPSLVDERIQSRLDLVHTLWQPGESAGRFHDHVELAQMIDYLCEDVLACFRHLAAPYGRTMISPFVRRAVLDAALSVPADQRYLTGLEGKHLLKRLLKRRLPEYPVRQRKGYTHVPFNDLYRDGPLSAVWSRYRVPEPFQDKARDELVGTPTQMTWNAVTFAIWRDRVQSNPHLEPVPGSWTFDWTESGRIIRGL